MSEPLPLRPVVSHEVVHTSGPFTVVAQKIRGEDGVEHDRTSIRHPGAVVVVPILETPEGPMVVLVRNERHAIESWLDELPAGGIEPGEEPIVAAARELREETGYEAATVEPLGRFYTSPGLTNEWMEAFVATGLRQVGQDLDAGEVLTVHPVLVGELFSRVDDGTLTDGKTMLGLLLARWKGWFAGESWPTNDRELG
ncbi:MAG: ADP-ribose pyrophosphatase [Phycisphaerales bacterium]|jgi:ADP-ribose pyrophosphatase